MAKHTHSEHGGDRKTRSKKLPRSDSSSSSALLRPEHSRTSHPAHLEELEQAAQTAIGADDDDARPFSDEAHPGMAFAAPDPQRYVDRGASIDPEDLGRHFLRDATVQDNFESEAGFEDQLTGTRPLGNATSEDTLETAGQDDRELPVRSAPFEEDDEREEPAALDVDLLSNVIHEASLFDQPTERGGTRAPRIESDETSASANDAREREQQQERRALRQLRTPPTHRARR